MLTELLKPKGETDVRRGVEEMGGGEEGESEDEEEEEDIEWYFEQKLASEECDHDTLLRDSSSHGYGFGFSHTSAYSQLLAEFGEILDLGEPDSLSHREREATRLAREESDFSEDHYLADLYDSEGCHFQGVDCLLWTPPEVRLHFSSEEQEQLLALPKKRHLIPRPDLASVHLTLADLLYGHCFTLRSSCGDPEPEHACWLAAKLAASLSACARFSSPRAVVRSCVRRALTYPWLRHYGLATLVWQDVVRLLEAGRAPVIQALLALQTSFTERPGYYIFNQLYVADYCSWLQSVPPGHFTSLATSLRRALAALTKADLGLELEELEQAARLVLEEEGEQEVEGLVAQMEKVNVCMVTKDDTLDSDDDSSDESSDDDESSDETFKEEGKS